MADQPEYLAKKYILSPQDKEAIKSRIFGDLDAALPIFLEADQIRRRNFDFYAGQQWTAAEVAAHERQFRKSYVFNEIQQKVDHIMGSQAQTRLDAKVVPREKSDAVTADLLSFLVKWYEQINNVEYVESEIFQDCLVGGVGISVNRLEYEDLEYGYPSIVRVPPGEMFWDTRSVRPDWSDARWVARRMAMTKFDAVESYPDFAEQILKAGSGMGYGNIYYNSGLMMTRRQEKAAGWSTHSDESREEVAVTEYYERSRALQYVVIDQFADAIYRYDNRQEAEEFMEGMLDSYGSQGETLLHPDGSDMVFMKITTVPVISQGIFVNDELLSYEPTALTDFPFTPCFCYFANGSYWSFVDCLIDPQILVNRSFSQLDYQLGASMKSAVTVMQALLPVGYTIEDLRREMAKTAPVIPVNQHGAVQQLPDIPPNPKLFENVMFGIQRMNDYAGGRNVLGYQENAAESGKAVVARAEQGGLARLPMFDKLRLWRQNTTLKAVWFMKNFMNPGQVARVMGNEDDVAYVELDDQILDTLREMKYDIVIDEATKSATMRERNFQLLKELFTMVPIPPEISIPLMLEYSELPETKKTEIKQQLEFYQNYMGQKMEAEKEGKLEAEVQDSLMKRKIKEEMLRKEELEEQASETEAARKGLQKQIEDYQSMKEEADMQAYNDNNSTQQVVSTTGASI